MYGILDKYIGKNILLYVLVIAVCLTLLIGLITFIDKTRYIGRGSIDFLFLCEYISLLLPGFFVSFFPLSVLLGGVISLGMMARNSEIVVMQSTGLSRLNIAFSALKSLIPAILIVMAIGEYVVSPLETFADSRLTEESNENRITVSKSGIWLREGNSFIGIQNSLSDGSLQHIVRYDFEDNLLKAESRAQDGLYKNGQWEMHNIVRRKYGEEGVETTFLPSEKWKLNLNPERVEIIGSTSNILTIKGLIDYISYLEDNGQVAQKYRLELYNKLIAPFATIVMLMLALSTVFGPLRSINMGTRILAGITLGFSYYVLNQIVAPSSLVYNIPPLLGASFSTIVFGAFALVLLRRKS